MKDAKVMDMRFTLCKKKMAILEKLADPEPIQMQPQPKRFPDLLHDNRKAALVWMRMLEDTIACDQQPE